MLVHRMFGARDDGADAHAQRGSGLRPEQRVALTIGNFDGVHLGHQAMLRRLVEAAAAQNLAPCVMTFEPHPREFFDPVSAPARLSNLREKLTLLREHGAAEVFLCRFDREMAQLAAAAFADLVFTRIGVRWLLVGDDFRFGAQRAGDETLLKTRARACGAAIEAMPSVEVNAVRVSSTVVREALAAGDLVLARDLLGRNYRMCGRVAHGEKLGRTLGFPTLNVLLKRARAPLAGIFAVRLHGLGEVRYGAASLGVRPTVSEALRPTLEVHLFDFQAEVYGAQVQVEFCCKLRDEQKYPNLAQLRAQILIDVQQARAYFNRA
jgi:riboflavin kinase/FMN adenylyltransferase